MPAAETDSSVYEAAARFVELLGAAGASNCVSNLVLEHMSATGLDQTLPMSVSDKHDAPTCYLCCPTVAYLDYAREELRTLGHRPLLTASMNILLSAISPVMRATGFDHQVQPNNWLLATNIGHPSGVNVIRRITATLIQDWPGRAIVWRSLNDVSDRRTLHAFAQCDYHLFPARQVYLFDCRTSAPRMHRDEKRDIALLDASRWQLVTPDTMKRGDFDRITALYGKLYLEKYTCLNPHYTPFFIEKLHELGLLSFFGLRNTAGTLDGAIGFFEHGEVMTAPIVGYETALPQNNGLYRQLMAIALRRARNRHMLFNMSAGAARFKLNRGASGAIEYTAVFNKHLPLRTRLSSWLIRRALNDIAVPIMKKYQL
jgi:hypothetical protein